MDTTKLQLSTTPQVMAALDALARSGMFGKTGSEVAEELMRQKLREVLREGWTEGPARGRK